MNIINTLPELKEKVFPKVIRWGQISAETARLKHNERDDKYTFSTSHEDKIDIVDKGYKKLELRSYKGQPVIVFAPNTHKYEHMATVSTQKDNDAAIAFTNNKHFCKLLYEVCKEMHTDSRIVRNGKQYRFNFKRIRKIAWEDENVIVYKISAIPTAMNDIFHKQDPPRDLNKIKLV